MLCEKCGAQYPDDAEKCPFCGAGEEKVEETVAVEETSAIGEVAEVVEEAANEVVEADAPKKSKKGLWAVVIAAVVVLVVAVGAFLIASNMYYTTANGDDASIFTVVKKEVQKVYAKVGDGESYLVKELGENESFVRGKDFIVKNNNIYFLNDDGGMSIMNAKNGKVKAIGEDLAAGTMIVSAKGDVVLFAGEDGVLYKTKKGGNATAIAQIGQTTLPNGMPAYNFIEGTNKVWYAVRTSEEASTASVYLETGDAVADKVSAVFHIGNDGATAVYSIVSSEEEVEVEAPAPAEGEAPAEPQKIVEKKYSLMLKDGGEPVVLNDKYEEGLDSVIILHKDKKGVVYVADKGDAPTDEATGEIIGMASGTLYFQPFGGGEKVALDTEVAVALLLEDISGSNYYYDASDRAEDETIAYMKDNTISLIKDFKPVENPAEFEFLTSNPRFGKDNDFMIYLTYNPVEEEVPAEDAEKPEGEEPAEEPAKEAPAPKLVYTEFVDGAWSEYTVVAEEILDYVYNEKSNKIYYLIQKGESEEKRSLYVYDIASANTSLVADDVLGYVTATEDGKYVYYVNAYNAETQQANVGVYTNGTASVLYEGITNFVASDDGTPYIVVADSDKADLFYADGTNVKPVTSNMKKLNFYR